MVKAAAVALAAVGTAALQDLPIDPLWTGWNAIESLLSSTTCKIIDYLSADYTECVCVCVCDKASDFCYHWLVHDSLWQFITDCVAMHEVTKCELMMV